MSMSATSTASSTRPSRPDELVPGSELPPINSMPDYNATSVATFDKHAARYADKYFALHDYDAYYALITAELQGRPARFLDLACGPGNVAAFVHAHCPEAQILCVDRSPQMLEQARQRVAALELLEADCRDLSAVPGRFDAAAFCFGLSYFDDADAALVLAELQRLLLPGAPLLLATVAGDPALSGEQQSSTGDKVYSFYREQDQIVALMVAAGFEPNQASRIASPASASVASTDVVVLARRR